MRVTVLFFGIALMLMSFGSVMGQGITLDGVDGLNGNGNIDDGATLTFHIRLTGDATAHLMLNNGYVFSSPDVVWNDVTGDYNTDHPWDTWFDFVKVINYWKTGSLADTVGTGLLSLFGSGLPAFFDGVAYSFTIGPVTGPPGGQLTLDSTWYPPSNPWMWDIVNENVAWGGPYTFTMEIGGEAPAITSTPITTATYGQPYAYDVEATGDPIPTYALTVAPAGMTIDAATGLIQWTPGDVGDYPVTVVVSNGIEPNATQNFSIAVAGIVPTFTSTPITTGTYNQPYSYDADADGYPAPGYALTTAPAGMTIDAVTGQINWTPGDVGDFDVVVEASNSAGSATQSFTITVEGIVPSFTSTPITTGTYNQPYSYDADADGYPAPGYVLTTAPAGMTIDAVTGQIDWTPGDVGDFDVVVEASNSAGSATQSFTITVEGIVPSFTSTPITTGTYNQPYSYDADADGYPAPGYALTTAPAGMTIDAVTGQIDWLPGDVGDFDVVVEASNSAGSATQSFTITVVGIAPSFTSTPITTGTYNQPYSYDADADGYPAPGYVLTTAPAGMTIDAVTGQIDWIPGDVGDFDVVVEASNSVGSATQSFTITVEGIAPSFTSTPITTGTYNQPYSYDADADGYPAPGYALTTSPAGMTIDAVTGQIDWIPGDVGDFDVVVEASNSVGSATQSFTITVEGIAPSFTSTPITTGTYNQPYSYNADADGYPAPGYALTTAPAGMTINAVTGQINWTPGDVGDFDVVVEASNSAGSATQSFTITVVGIAPSFTSTPITTGTYNQPYSYDADADGYPAPGYALTTAPAGMTIDAVTGQIDWLPGDVGDFDVVVEASNSAGSATQSFTITVVGIAPSFTSTPITTGTYNQPYSYNADADGYPAPGYALTTAPAGMTIDAVTGQIDWTPGGVGDFDVVVEASNSAGSATQSFTITVVGIAPAFTSSPQLGGVVDELYSYDADASGYPAPTYALLTAPGGMTIDPVTGLVQWTPTAEGDYDVSIEADNGYGTDIQSYTVTVVLGPEAPVITSTPVTSVTVFDLYSYDVQATGNPAPTFSLTTAPGGMTIDPATGLIQWTPAAVGDYPVTVVASNSIDPDAVQSFTITVLGIAPAFTSTPITTGTCGEPYSYDVEASAVPAPTFALITAPPGMTIDPVTGLIEWTPDDVGDFSVVVEAFNSAGSATQSFNITVMGTTPAFTTSPPTSGVVGELYTYDPDASGCPAPTFALLDAPAGMTIQIVTGLIEWIPTAVGDYTVTIEADNGFGADVQSYTITVGSGPEAPVITSTPVTDGAVSALYTYDVEATGNPAPTFALTVAPSGMTIDGATGLIQWTPAAVGDYPVTVVASNTIEPDAVQSFTITVVVGQEAPIITSTPVTNGQVGEPYSYDADATGNPVPTFALLAESPGDMTIDVATGLVEWAPTVAGIFTVGVEACNGVNPCDTQWYEINVIPAFEAPVITTTPVTNAIVGQLYTYDVNATGYPAAVFALITAPAGMIIDAVTGLIQWTPTVSGDFDVIVEASNDYGADTQQFIINVPGEPFTYCSPQPTVLKVIDRILYVHIVNENPDDVVLESIRVQGKIPAYTEVTVEGGEIITDVFIMRFLGSSGFRPITANFEAVYTVEYDKTDGSHPVLTGDFALIVYPGDVTFDGQVTIDDLIFVADYFFNEGPVSTYENQKLPQFMDVNQDGNTNPIDLVALRVILGM